MVLKVNACARPSYIPKQSISDVAHCVIRGIQLLYPWIGSDTDKIIISGILFSQINRDHNNS